MPCKIAASMQQTLDSETIDHPFIDESLSKETVAHVQSTGSLIFQNFRMLKPKTIS